MACRASSQDAAPLWPRSSMFGCGARLKANVPYDRMVHELIAGSPSREEDSRAPGTHELRGMRSTRSTNPNRRNLAATVSRLFLGIQTGVRAVPP